MVKYADWEIESMEPKQRKKLLKDQPFDMEEVFDKRRKRIYPDSPCQVNEVALENYYVHSARRQLQIKYSEQLSDKAISKQDIRLQNGSENINRLNITSNDFMDQLHESYRSAKGTKTQKSAAIESDSTLVHCKAALEQYFFGIENVGQYINNIDEVSPAKIAGYRMSSDKLSKVWVYPYRMKMYERWGQNGRTGKWVIDKIEELGSNNVIKMSQAGLGRMVNGSKSDSDCIYIVYASHDLSVCYILGYIDVGSIKSVNMEPELDDDGKTMLYKFWLDELTTLPNSVPYSDVRTRL